MSDSGSSSSNSVRRSSRERAPSHRLIMHVALLAPTKRPDVLQPVKRARRERDALSSGSSDGIVDDVQVHEVHIHDVPSSAESTPQKAMPLLPPPPPPMVPSLGLVVPQPTRGLLHGSLPPLCPRPPIFGTPDDDHINSVPKLSHLPHPALPGERDLHAVRPFKPSSHWVVPAAKLVQVPSAVDEASDTTISGGVKVEDDVLIQDSPTPDHNQSTSSSSSSSGGAGAGRKRSRPHDERQSAADADDHLSQAECKLEESSPPRPSATAAEATTPAKVAVSSVCPQCDHAVETPTVDVACRFCDRPVHAACMEAVCVNGRTMANFFCKLCPLTSPTHMLTPFRHGVGWQATQGSRDLLRVCAQGRVFQLPAGATLRDPFGCVGFEYRPQLFSPQEQERLLSLIGRDPLAYAKPSNLTPSITDISRKVYCCSERQRSLRGGRYIHGPLRTSSTAPLVEMPMDSGEDMNDFIVNLFPPRDPFVVRTELLCQQIAWHCEDLEPHCDRERRDKLHTRQQPGADGVGDRITSLTLRQPCWLLMRETVCYENCFAVRLSPGDVYTMCDESRWRWQHGILLDDKVHDVLTSRVSLVWRQLEEYPE
eukprot:m.143786 g.143786  ORF g.143786 m.143786 type:complete len:596 (+) comp16748_c0_seq2:307-2094(+)